MIGFEMRDIANNGGVEEYGALDAQQLKESGGAAAGF
jgi:hypothetical protein